MIAAYDHILVDRKAIARRFSCLVDTVDRMIKLGELVTFQTRPSNSPIRARSSEAVKAMAKLEGRG